MAQKLVHGGLVGYVDGQTTNPTLISKNPEVRTLVSSGHKLSSREELEEYKKIVQMISPLELAHKRNSTICGGLQKHTEAVRLSISR